VVQGHQSPMQLAVSQILAPEFPSVVTSATTIINSLDHGIHIIQNIYGCRTHPGR